MMRSHFSVLPRNSTSRHSARSRRTARRVRLAAAKHGARDGAPVTFGDLPVLDAQARSGAKIGKRRDIARRIDPVGAGTELIIDDNPALDAGRPAASASWNTRCNAHAKNHEVCRQRGSILELDAASADGFRSGAEMELDAVLFVKLLGRNRRSHRPTTRASGTLSVLTTSTSTFLARSEAATSRPMKLEPMTTARAPSRALATMSRESASVLSTWTLTPSAPGIVKSARRSASRDQ